MQDALLLCCSSGPEVPDQLAFFLPHLAFLWCLLCHSQVLSLCLVDRSQENGSIPILSVFSCIKGFIVFTLLFLFIKWCPAFRDHMWFSCQNSRTYLFSAHIQKQWLDWNAVEPMNYCLDQFCSRDSGCLRTGFQTLHSYSDFNILLMSWEKMCKSVGIRGWGTNAMYFLLFHVK